MTEIQTEFPLSFPICAWCRPRGLIPHHAAGTVSHGICLRHLRKLKLSVQQPARRRSPRGPRLRVCDANLRLAL